MTIQYILFQRYRALMLFPSSLPNPDPTRSAPGGGAGAPPNQQCRPGRKSPGGNRPPRFLRRRPPYRLLEHSTSILIHPGMILTAARWSPYCVSRWPL